MRRSALVDVLAEVRDAQIAFDQAAVGMALMALDGRYLRVNHALAEFLGRPERELLGTTWQAVIHPDDAEARSRAVEQLIAGVEPTVKLAQRFLGLHGALGWGLLSVSLVRSDRGEPLCLSAQIVDITEQRAAEERLRLMASIVESAGDGILSNTLDGTIVTWNSAAERIYGYTADEMVGRSIFTIAAPDRAEEARGLLQQVGHGEQVVNHTTAGLRKDHSAIHLSVTMSPVRDARGAVVLTSSIARDVTEQQRRAGEVDAAMSGLGSTLRAARQAEARSGRLLSEATRYLRDRVAAIHTCAETLLRESSTTGLDDLLVGLAREASRVSGLVDGLSRINRLERGEALLRERCDLSEVCRSEVERAQSLVPRLDVVAQVEPRVWLEIDAGAMRRSLANLLENARRHAVRRIGVAMKTVDGGVQLRVADDGPGLPEAMVERAFEPFVALDGQGGSGMGLAVARAFIRAHGGDLTYESGAFVIRLPLAPAGAGSPSS